MYKKVEKDKKPIGSNGVSFTPLVTLADEFGGRCQISKDGGSYVLSLLRGGKYFKTPYIFKEAFEEIKKLPELEGSELKEGIHYDLYTKICELSELLKPFFEEFEVENKSINTTTITITNRVNKDQTYIYITRNDSNTIYYTFGDRNHGFLSVEYTNLFHFYYDFLNYMKLIKGLGENKHYKY